MAYVEASVRGQQIVAAARRVMEREGVAGTSMRGVAAEAEIPLGTLQYVFRSKEQLLRAVIESVVDDIAGLLEASLDPEKGAAEAIGDGLRAFWSELVRGQISLQVMQGELLNYALRTPGHQDLARLQYDRYLSILTGWGERLTSESPAPPVPFERLARVMLAGLDGLILQYVSAPDDERAEQDLESLIEMVLRYAGWMGPR